MKQVMLRTDALAKSFTLHLQGGVRIPVLSGVGLELHRGECVVLSGPSGVGKSTLLRSLYGNCRAESGRVLIRHNNEMVDLAILIRLMREPQNARPVRDTLLDAGDPRKVLLIVSARACNQRRVAPYRVPYGVTHRRHQ